MGGLNKKARFMFPAREISDRKYYKKTMIVLVRAIMVRIRQSNWLDKHFGGPIYIEMSTSIFNNALNAKQSRPKELKGQGCYIPHRFQNLIGKVYP